MTVAFGPRRGAFIEIGRDVQPAAAPAGTSELSTFDQVYRSLCAMLYNYVPMSGHPGGSISSGRFAPWISTSRFAQVAPETLYS